MMNELKHHGIPGQKWGVKHGPPYPLKGGSYTPVKKEITPKKHVRKNSQYDKKHIDKTITTEDTLTTLSYDKNRTSDTDMFYATYDSRDRNQYRAVFNRKAPQDIFDENGEKIGTGQFYKYQIDNKLKADIKVASEDSGATVFKKLYKEQRDFYNFVTDRMESLFVQQKYKFKGYREARDVLNKLKDRAYTPSEDDISTLYRMFNYVIPNDGGGNAKVAKDVATQRARFFNELKKEGYGGVLDTNDAIYGGFKAKAPVIVFDMDKIIPDDIKRLDSADKVYSVLAYEGRKILKL